MERLPVLYHVEYNLKIQGARNSSLLPNKPAKIFAILQGTPAITATTYIIMSMHMIIKAFCNLSVRICIT